MLCTRKFKTPFLFVFYCLASCSMPLEDRILGHFEPHNWGQAVSGHWNSWETQGLPEVLALAYVPYVRHNDRLYTHEFAENLITSERAGLNLARGLEWTALGFGMFDTIRGDEGAMIETWLEAETLNHFMNETLKSARSRERPNGTNDKSFPSGAAQNAFLGATLAARWIDDQGSEWPYKLGYGLYIPAIFVARSRVENRKHWYSDVVAGAALGTIIANTIYNLHFGDQGSGQGGIFPREWSHRMRIEPFMNEEGVGLELSIRF